MNDGPPVLPPGIDLYILTGPTAVGKSELALAWAEEFGAEIVSCDSLLFYRGMDIGTAKPSAEERARVPHHLIDVAEPGEPWNIQEYVVAAARKVMEIHQRGRRVLVTGGSGFYLKSFLEPVIDRIQVPEAVVRQVAELEKKGREALAAELLRIDPDAAEVLDTENPRRVARALERCLATGRSVRELREAMRNEPYPFMHCRPQTSLLIRDREELRERIVRRVDEMLAGGLAEEVRRLVSRGLRNNPSAATAIGYRETSRYLEGELTFAQLREEMIRNTNRLVKKQLTWFRYQLPESSRTISLTGREDLPVKELFVGLGGA